MPLYTLGYEGMSIEQFVDRLEKSRVRTVVDVRQMPLSRKPGFSKRALAAALAGAGVAYVHMVSLGCPKPVRDRYKDDGDWSAYAKAFRAYLKRHPAALAELSVLAKKRSTCLICFEADFERCHRSIVARAAPQLIGRDPDRIEEIWKSLLFLTHATAPERVTDGFCRTISTSSANWDFQFLRKK